MRKFFLWWLVHLLYPSISFMLLFFLHRARSIRDGYNQLVNLDDFIPMFNAIIEDKSIPKEATNLLFMSRKSKRTAQVDSNIIYSIFQRNPKRADVYWFIHADIFRLSE
ncbi:MAG: hypothetical protein IPM95_12535 [Sphingobacteriales bacterium]|nr:hypothetical protein [Sphingobacteriales bacterium]